MGKNQDRKCQDRKSWKIPTKYHKIHALIHNKNVIPTTTIIYYILYDKYN